MYTVVYDTYLLYTNNFCDTCCGDGEPSGTVRVYNPCSSLPPCSGVCPTDAEASGCDINVFLDVSGSESGCDCVEGSHTLVLGSGGVGNQWYKSDPGCAGADLTLDCTGSGNWKLTLGTLWGSVTRQSSSICPPSGYWYTDGGHVGCASGLTVRTHNSGGGYCL